MFVNKTRVHCIVGSALAMVLASPAIAQVADAVDGAPAPSDGASTAAEEGSIVVYGMKGARASALERTPAAITAINAATVQQMQLLDVSDVGRLMPNAALSTSGTYVAFPSFQIRGVGVALSTPTVDPAVTVSVDGMPYAYPVGTNIDTFDIESLEVFRGPQGVLQGRNSTGGVVALRTRRPTEQFAAEFQATVGSYDRLDFAGFVAGPIVPDKLLAKLAVIRRTSDGFFGPRGGGTFVVAPNNPSGTNPMAGIKQSSRNKSWLVRPSIVVKPTENFEISLLGEYSKTDNTGANSVVYTNAPGGLVQSLTRLYGYTPPAGDYAVNSNDGNATNVEAWRGVAEMSLDLDGLGVFTSITGYRKVKYSSDLDSDSTPFTIFGFPDNHQSSDQFSQELRFASTFSDSVDLLVGGYYSLYDLNVVERRRQSRIASGGAYNEFVYQQAVADQRDKVAAIFANVSWHLTDRLTATAGGRYNYERKSVDIIPLLSCTGTGFGACSTVSTAAKKSWTDFSPRASLEFQARNGLMFYLSYTKGFRSGAFNSRATSALAIGPTSPESVASFEAGMKGSFFDNLLKLNLTGFHAKYDDIQRSLTITTLTTLANAASATINGIEAEVTLRPAEGFELGATLGYLDAKYDDFKGLNLDSVPGNQPADDVLARKLKFPSVSKYTAAFSASYEFGLPDFDPRFRASASYNYRGKAFLDTLNVPVSYQKGYGRLDASLSVSNDNWTVTAFGRNLNNARYLELVSTFFSVTAPLEYVAFGGQPRILGLELRYKY